MKPQTLIQSVNWGEHGIRERLQQVAVEDTKLANLEKHLTQNLDGLTVAGNLDGEREGVSLRLAQVRIKRESLQRSKSVLLESQLSARAKMMAVRLRLEIQRVMQEIREDARYSKDLRFALRAVRTVYEKWRAHRQTVYARLAQMAAHPDAASWRTWTETPLLYLVADALPLPEFVEHIQNDMHRKRLLSLSEWKAHNGLRVAVNDGSALETFFRGADDDTIKRVQAVVRTDPRIGKILDMKADTGQSKSLPEKPQQPKSTKKQSVMKRRERK